MMLRRIRHASRLAAGLVLLCGMGWLADHGPRAVHAQAVASPSRQCHGPFGNDVALNPSGPGPYLGPPWTAADGVHIRWSGDHSYDAFNVRYRVGGGGEPQVEVGGGTSGGFTIPNVPACTWVTYKVQGCDKRFLSSSSCSRWDEGRYRSEPARPSGPDTCRSGYVWRGAFPRDLVCVLPATRDQVQSDNAQRAARIDPAGPYGPRSCKSGYVWRLARPDDLVCVTPQVRAQAQADNAAMCHRLASCS